MNRATRALAVVLPVLALLLLFTLPSAPTPQVPDSAAVIDPVLHSTLACPQPLVPRPETSTVDAGVVGDLDPVTEPDPETKAGPLGGPRPLALEPGRLVRVPAGRAPVMVTAAGTPAQGLFGTRVEQGQGTLSATACLQPRAQWWFTGAGAGVDHASELLLANVDQGPAIVDVRLHGATRSVDDEAGRGLTLAPGESLSLPLPDLAPGSAELTVEVVASRGRVVAHVADRVLLGTATSAEWLPPAAAPNRDLVLTGLATGAGRSTLLVTNPGDQQALVTPQLLTAGGAFVPLGLEELSVDPGTVLAVDLTKVLSGAPTAVRLRSETEVLATVRSVEGGDVAYAAAAPPVTGPATLATAGQRTVLHLVAGDQAAVFRIAAYDASGNRLSRDARTVPPAGLVEWRPPAGDIAYAVVSPLSGQGYAGVVHAGPGLAAQPLTELVSSVARPQVLPFSGGQPDS